MNSLIKKPSAWLPIALPSAFLVVMLIGLATHGVPAREKDEGVIAHLFQIWIVLEPLIIAYFAVKWLPQAPWQGMVIVAAQVILSLAVIAPVFLLKL